jgi:putative endonuclease
LTHPNNPPNNVRTMSRPTPQPATYIMASARNGTLYVGVTANLPHRVTQHRESLIPGFTVRYRCHLLVQYELHPDMPTAIAREKQLKAGSRFKKLALIERTNPTWRDLYDDII